MTGKGAATCEPVNWRKIFSFAGGVCSRETAGRSGKVQPFPTYLSALVETLSGTTVPRQQPLRRNADGRSFRSEVEQALEPLLPGGEIGMDRIAPALGVSRQTLYRRLKEEGTTFEQLLDSLRRRLALHYIDREGLGVKQTAYRLGFAEPASFSRAFKRWTGRSPGRRS